jgi:hypothetical protein
MKNLVFAGMISLLLLGTLCGQETKKGKIAVGDTVEIEWVGKKLPAEVTELLRTGWIKVKFMYDGIMLTPAFPPDQVRPLTRPSAKGTSGKSKSKGSTKQELRTWADQSGKFKVEARFVELRDGQVTLERADGRTVTLALGRLSEEDQRIAKELGKQSGESENPFEPTDVAKKPKPAPGERAVTEADWSDVEQIVVDDPGAWALQVESAIGLDKKIIAKPILLAKGGGAGKANARPPGFFENFDSLLFVPSRAETIAVTVDKPPGQSSTVNLHRCNLATGKASEPHTMPMALKPVDVDPSGEWLLARTDFHVGNTGIEGSCEVSVWKLTGKVPQHQVTWDPNEKENFHKQAPTLARFVDSDHVLTLCFPGRLVLWDATTARAIYKMELAAGGVPALSPELKYLAAPVNNGLYVFDALSGKTMGKLSSEIGPGTVLSFRPDGKQLGALSPQRLQVWDLETGELYRDIYFSWPLRASRMDWVSDGYVLVAGENLVDLERRVVLWQYQHDGATPVHEGYGVLDGMFWFGLTNRNRGERGVFHAALPHDEAKKFAASLSPESLLAVKPGTTITLRLNVRGTGDEQQQVTQALTARLRDLGMNVAPGGRVVLEAVTETGETREIAYRNFGAFGQVDKTTVTEQISRVKLVEDGKTIWESVVVGGTPFVLHTKEGQTLQDALAPYQKPDLGFFSHVKLPQYVARPNEKGAYGATSLTPQGFQPATVRPPVVQKN